MWFWVCRREFLFYRYSYHHWTFTVSVSASIFKLPWPKFWFFWLINFGRIKFIHLYWKSYFDFFQYQNNNCFNNLSSHFCNLIIIVIYILLVIIIVVSNIWEVSFWTKKYYEVAKLSFSCNLLQAWVLNVYYFNHVQICKSNEYQHPCAHINQGKFKNSHN